MKIYENFWLFKLPFMRGFSAITLTKKRVAFAGKFNLWDYAHELTHVAQMCKYFWFFIWDVLYVLQWVSVGFVYSRIPYELEARSKTGERYALLVSGVGIEDLDPKFRPH